MEFIWLKAQTQFQYFNTYYATILLLHYTFNIGASNKTAMWNQMDSYNSSHQNITTEIADLWFELP